MTLAHELGHGVHQVLAAAQGQLMADTPLTLAETASVFGEMLTFRALLDAEQRSAGAAALLAGKVEDMLNTVVRQIAFHEFERRVHDERREAELTAERLGEIWLGGAAREPGAGVPLRRGIPALLVLHPAFHPLAVLRLRLCVRRLPGELALRGLPRPSQAFREVLRHAARPAAPSATRSCWRPSASTPPIPASGPACGFAHESRASIDRARARPMATSPARRSGPRASTGARATASAGGSDATPGVGRPSAGWRRGRRRPRYLGLKIDRAAHAAELKAALGGLKGPLMKVAQILSTIPDALPEEYVAELGAAADPTRRPWAGRSSRRRMVAELGPDWQKRFAAFEHDAAAAASLGQVHRADAKDGRRLACKLQYPDMASAVEADLAPAQGALRHLPALRPARSTEQDPRRNGGAPARGAGLPAARPSKWRSTATCSRDEPGVHVPEPLPELSTGRLLTMTWLDGRPLSSFVDAPPEERDALARNMFRAWYVPFYEYGVIHGDPHLGNYTRAAGPVHQPARLRLHPGVQAGVRQGRDRPLLGAAQRRPRPGRARLSRPGASPTSART